MIIESREDYINYRFRRAKESFDEALILAENKKWNTVSIGCIIPVFMR